MPQMSAEYQREYRARKLQRQRKAVKQAGTEAVAEYRRALIEHFNEVGMATLNGFAVAHIVNGFLIEGSVAPPTRNMPGMKRTS